MPSIKDSVMSDESGPIKEGNKMTADSEGYFEKLEAKGNAENQQAVAVSHENPLLSNLENGTVGWYGLNDPEKPRYVSDQEFWGVVFHRDILELYTGSPDDKKQCQ
ncbi:hypothetical protein AnigIFM49718_009015 [Aspergillus niger]|nr:hypothetical protein AnigIFM49718_009015 [Aspergillus niger]